MDTPALIPTSGKDRLPKGWSYPFSASDISSCLAGLDVYPQCWLCFYPRSLYWHSDWQKKVRELGEIELLECRSVPDTGEWCINVYSLPSLQRQAAKAALTATAIPALRHWLSTRRERRFSAFFHLADETIRVETFTP